MKRIIIKILSYLGLYQKLIINNKKYLFFKIFNKIKPVKDIKDIECETILFLPSEELKIEISEFPALSKNKIKKIIYYNLKSRYQDSVGKLDYFFIILSRDRVKKRCKVALFVYNKAFVKSCLTKNETITDFSFNILSFILQAKNYKRCNSGLFLYKIDNNLLLILMKEKIIEYIRLVPYKNKKDIERIIKSLYIDKGYEIYTNLKELKFLKFEKIEFLDIDDLSVHADFLKVKKEVIGRNIKLLYPQKLLSIIKKIAINGSIAVLLIIILLHLFISYVDSKKSAIQNRITKEARVFKKVEKIKKEVKQFENKKSLILNQSVWFYYLYHITKSARDKVFFISIEYSSQKDSLIIDAYTEKFELAQGFIERIVELKLFNDVVLNNTEQYSVKSKNFLKFRVKITGIRLQGSKNDKI